MENFKALTNKPSYNIVLIYLLSDAIGEKVYRKIHKI